MLDLIIEKIWICEDIKKIDSPLGQVYFFMKRYLD